MEWWDSFAHLDTSLLYTPYSKTSKTCKTIIFEHPVSTNPMHLEDRPNAPPLFPFLPLPQQTYKGGTKRLSELSLLKLSDMKGRLPRGGREWSEGAGVSNCAPTNSQCNILSSDFFFKERKLNEEASHSYPKIKLWALKCTRKSQTIQITLLDFLVPC